MAVQIPRQTFPAKLIRGRCRMLTKFATCQRILALQSRAGRSCHYIKIKLVVVFYANNDSHTLNSSPSFADEMHWLV